MEKEKEKENIIPEWICVGLGRGDFASRSLYTSSSRGGTAKTSKLSLKVYLFKYFGDEY